MRIERVAMLAALLAVPLGGAAVANGTNSNATSPGCPPGFVVRGDMSGHAVTVGPARGIGRIATTWAGYPAPAVVGAATVWVAGRGWAAPTLTAVMVVLVVRWLVPACATTPARSCSQPTSPATSPASSAWPTCTAL